MLPLVQSDGNIILLRHVMISRWKGFCYFRKGISSFALFKGDDNGDVKASQVSKPSSSVTVHDKAFIRQLQTWLTKNLILAGMIENVLPLKEIQKCRCSLMCKLMKYAAIDRLSISLSLTEIIGFCTWAGTDYPILTFETNPNLEGEEQYPLQLEPVALPRSILGVFPPVGSVLRIIADQPYKHLCGKWDLPNEVWVMVWRVKASSELVPLSNEDEIVISRQRCCDVSQSHNLNRLPQAWLLMPSRITDKAENNMDVVTHSEVTCEYKCVARVITSHPSLGDWEGCFFQKWKIPDQVYLGDPSLEFVQAYLMKMTYHYLPTGYNFTFSNSVTVLLEASTSNHTGQ